jgi:hypothetical protein
MHSVLLSLMQDCAPGKGVLVAFCKGVGPRCGAEGLSFEWELKKALGEHQRGKTRSQAYTGQF